MTKREEREQIVNKIVCAAQVYKECLLGRTFLYVFGGKYIEVSFRKQEFAHLTGANREMSAKAFYKEAERGTLRENQISFSKRYPMDLCKKKVDSLTELYKVAGQDGFVLEDISTNTACYKFGFTELNFTLCLGEDLDNSGNKRSEYFIAQSFRVEDGFDRTQNVYDIDMVFEKRNDEKKYNKLLLKNEEFQGELSEEVKDKLQAGLKY